jgi:hypothetical protein
VSPTLRVALVLSLVAFGIARSRADDEGVINLSHDLVRLGIAGQNLRSDDPSLDSRPLFQAAVRYVSSHPVHWLTADRGTYYFLTPQDPQSYLRLPALSDLVIDLAGSKIVFATAFLQGLTLSSCHDVTLTNLQIDFLQPPYTQVVLQSVDAAVRTLAYAELPNWVDPAAFTAPPVPVALWAAVFRNGEIVPATSRMQVAQPVTPGQLSLVQDNTPWTQGATLATLLPGDTVVVTERGGQPPILVYRGDHITVSNATVLGASAIAVLLNGVSHSVVDHVQVHPPPGGLIASNADGIHVVDSGADNHIMHSFVSRTLDDALAIDSLDAGTVLSQSGPRQVTIDCANRSHFADGTLFDFVDPVSGQEHPGGIVIGQVPPDAGSALCPGTVELSFDRDLPSLPAGTGLAYGERDARGAGSSIEDNVIDDILFGRGVWIGGAEGVTVTRNTIGHTSNGGIAVAQDTLYYPLPPAHDILIDNNELRGSLGPMASGTGTEIAVGSILVESSGSGGGFAPAPVNTNIVIEGNLILDSGRCSIWVGQLDHGAIRNNVIERWDQHPELPLFGVNATLRAQLLQDFTQAIVVHDSLDVAPDANAIGSGPD